MSSDWNSEINKIFATTTRFSAPSATPSPSRAWGKDGLQGNRACVSGDEVELLVHLVAIHNKQCGDSASEERLDGENGLAPMTDYLFDSGLFLVHRTIASPVAIRVSVTTLRQFVCDLRHSPDLASTQSSLLVRLGRAPCLPRPDLELVAEICDGRDSV